MRSRLAPTNTREALSFRNMYVQQSAMADFYATSNRIVAEQIESEEEDEDAVYQPEMIDFYGRKGAGGGESLAELARQLEPEPQP